MRHPENRFIRALAEAADEENITLTTEDLTTLRAELWHDYPDNCFLHQEDIEARGLLAGTLKIHPEYGAE
jgi:sulfur transfer complex TusBCD TusB component (DsrH family)